MKAKEWAYLGGGYLAMGLVTAGYSVYLGANGRPHFSGFSDTNPVAGLLETVFVWPWALYINISKG